MTSPTENLRIIELEVQRNQTKCVNKTNIKTRRIFEYLRGRVGFQRIGWDWTVVSLEIGRSRDSKYHTSHIDSLYQKLYIGLISDCINFVFYWIWKFGLPKNWRK